MSTTNPIDPFKDVTVRSEEMKRAEKKQPFRNFQEIAEKVQERLPQKEEEQGEAKDAKKGSPKGTPSTLSKSAERAPPAPLSLFDLAREHSEAKEEKDLPERKTASAHPIEQPDLSSVNPMPPPEKIVPQQTVSSATEARVLKADPQAMQEIIDQIVKQVYTVKGSEGLKETVIELEGRFKGARLIIKEFDFAKNEMNITIDNLKSGSDQALLNAHKGELVDKLAKEHQIVVHIFTATTQLEPTQLDYRHQGEESFARGEGEKRGNEKNPEEEKEET